MQPSSVPVHAALKDYVIGHFSVWCEGHSVASLDQLSERKADVLLRVLQAEVAQDATFAKRDECLADFYQFDLGLNGVLSGLLDSRNSKQALLDSVAPGLFVRDPEQEKLEQASLQARGYHVSAHKLTAEHLNLIQKEIGDYVFTNRGIFSSDYSGAEISSAIQAGNAKRFSNKNGDTLWLKDLNCLCKNEFFSRLAFDPYILSTVAHYLGCIPVHVQTNLWFSFPTLLEKNNLSTNAQMFHQDKEFTKFLKVFIYLSDVEEDSGPHRYVEGSHIDEAHTRGIEFSHRVPDDQITRYYAADRIKTLLGPAGTITFGDTSCVHKGEPVVAGHRIMLQLEYASSLYLSPVAPFEQMSDRLLQNMPYPEATRQRLTANYNNAWRADFMARAEAQKPAEPSTLRKLMRLAKRYVKQW